MLIRPAKASTDFSPLTLEYFSALFFISGLHHRATAVEFTKSTEDEVFFSESNWGGFQIVILNGYMYVI